MHCLLPLLLAIVVLCGCTGTEEGRAQVIPATPAESSQVSDTDVSAGYAEDPAPLPPLPKESPLPLPAGLYRATLTTPEARVQTIQFLPNRHFLMQESYGGEKDSIVTTKGTWSPSNGFIWLYRDNIAWGRYRWKGDTLQYYHPDTQKSTSMQKLSSILDNAVWQQKPASGVTLFAIGTEPFWTVERKANDSLSFLLAEKGVPEKLKLVQQYAAGDSVIYIAQSDSAALRVVVLPYFCSDGMSDHTYPNKVLVQFNRQSFSGCGVQYQ